MEESVASRHEVPFRKKRCGGSQQEFAARRIDFRSWAGVYHAAGFRGAGFSLWGFRPCKVKNPQAEACAI